MEPHFYQQYISLRQQHKKQEAQERLTDFLASFHSFKEKKRWVHDFLTASEEEPQKFPAMGVPISHEIYVHLVLPVLVEGYKQRDAWSTLWLAKTIQNVSRIDTRDTAIEHKSMFEFLKEAYALEPSSEHRQLLLKADIQWFNYCQHEWPSGILYGSNGATAEECEEILQEVMFARSLDANADYAAFLTEFEQQVREYQHRLQTGFYSQHDTGEE